MVNYCCVFGCRNSAVSSPNISMHRFPSDYNCYLQWVEKLRMGKHPSPTMCVCSTHFVAEDFKSFPLTGNPYHRKLLKPNAVPSMNLPKRPLDMTHEKIMADRMKWLKHQDMDAGVGEQKEYSSEISIIEQVQGIRNTASAKEENSGTENICQDISNDSYCWICHKEGNVLCCEVCPRVFHLRCLGEREEPPGDWVCPECQATEKAENVDTRSPSMAMLNMEEFYRLLRFSIHKMKQHANSCLNMAATQPPWHLFRKNDWKLSVRETFYNVYFHTRSTFGFSISFRL